MTTLAPHPLASFFPPLDADEFAKLVKDVREHGLIHPVVTYENKVLDGWHRYKAATKVGIRPKFEAFNNGSITPLDYVISANVLRRHLTIDQRAVLALELEKKYADEAKETEIANKRLTKAQRSSIRSNSTSQTKKERKSAERAGKMLHVSGASVHRAKAIARKAPEEIEAIKAGKTTIADALRRVHFKEDQVYAEEKDRRRRESPIRDRAVASFIRKVDDFRAELVSIQSEVYKFSPEAKPFVIRRLDRLSDQITKMKERLSA